MVTKEKKKKNKGASLAPFADYDELIKTVRSYGDPFDFLTSLKQTKGDNFDPASLAGGRAAREANVDISSIIMGEANIAEMVRSVMDDTALTPKDTKIDDGGMPLAKNIYEWVTKDSFAGTVMTPFIEQLIWGVILFGEFCPRCSDVEWLYEDHVATDTYDKFEKKVCMLENGNCPSCKGRKSEFVRSGEMRFYQELAVCAGQRSGKSATTGGILTPYMTHRILKMQKPAEVYGISSSTMLHGTFCALTYAQAKETLWEFYYGTLIESNWFQEYHSMLRHYEDLYGQSLFKFNDTFVSYRCRNLMFYPAGPDKRILRGRTRIFAGVDEIGYFDNADTKKIKISASGVYDALDSSLLTVRGAAERLINAGYDDVLNGMSMNVSSPSSQRDKIMELVRTAQNSEVIYGIHRPTWEVNPTLPRSSKVITERYRTDPSGAARDFGAEPPLSANPFIENKIAIANCIGTKRNPIQIKLKQRSETPTRQASRWATIEKIKKSKQPSMLTIDAGYTNNSFAVTVGHVSPKTSLFHLDLIVEVMPKPGYPLNYTKLFNDIICPVIEARNVKVMLADRWNSLKLLSDAEALYPGLVARQYSLKYKDMWMIKTMLDQEEIVFPRLSGKSVVVADCLEFPQDDYPSCFEHREMDHMVMQMLTVQDTGTQVTKGDNLTDDIWRAAALLCWGLNNEDYEEFLMLDPGDEAKFRPQALGCSKLGSGGGKSMGAGDGLSMGGHLGVWKKGR